MRRTSVSLPTRNVEQDPHEKPNRYGSQGASNSVAVTLEKIKTAWMTQSQRSRYLKTGGLLLFIIFLFYYLAPKGTNVHTQVPDIVSAPAPVVQNNAPNDGQKADPSVGKTKCLKSSDKSKPLLQYALMIDAGSTGSRIHVYRFNNCGPTPELEEEGFFQTPKREGGSGLSSYKTDAEGAAKSLDPLMDDAFRMVPEAYHSCTPVAVKATAGLRMLGAEAAQNILDAVRTRLETRYPFPVVSKENNGVIIMDGKDEGVYAWITTNYLLGKIGGPDKSPTAAVFDLGGGSTQIVFEPTFQSTSSGMPETLAEGDHKYKLSFGGRDFELYQHSHLGFGLMSARGAIHKALVEARAASAPSDSEFIKNPIVNPCIAPGMSREVEVKLSKDHRLGDKITVKMEGPAAPSAPQCRKLAESILQKDAKCDLAPCSFKGVHQPSLAKTFAREDVYVFSYFFDRTDPLGMPGSFTLRELIHLTEQVCGGDPTWGTFRAVPGAIDELRGRPEHCLDLNFMVALLHTGYEMPIDREVKIAKKIKGNELGWCLGASLPLLNQNSGWKCKINQVS